MKVQEKTEARRIRQSEGASIKEIAKRLDVAKSSVSVWVRDIKLTQEQWSALNENHPGPMKASQMNRAVAMEKRQQFQNLGREDTKKNDRLHLAGCMLYWAEGTKSRSSLKFSNSDPDMHRVFVRFLKENMLIPVEDIIFWVHCYTDHHAADEIEKYWLGVLGLPKESLRKTIVNHISRSSRRQRHGILKYGTCHVVVHDVKVLQRIYGAIQEYAGIANEKWIG